MRLAQALRLTRPARLAFVGAGGKTTALFRLAHQLIESRAEGSPDAVWVSATTHLAQDQLNLADHHVVIQSVEDLGFIESPRLNGVVLLTGPSVEGDRISGLEPDLLAGLFQLAERRGVYLLLEADGSRMRPVKAPANHEPAIPEWVQTVVVVAGMKALGKPLTDAWVHRPQLFAGLSGLTEGEPITPSALVQVLSHPAGGLKSIPATARRVVLLNQADTPELQSQANGMAERLLASFHSVLVASLAPPVGNLAIPEGKGVFSVREPVAGIVLAAGGSRRLGQPKQVLQWRGSPLVRHVVGAALGAGLQPVLVVTGHAALAVKQALAGLPVIFIHNPDWADGQSTSVIAGIRELPPETGAAVFLLADQPQVPVSLLRGLLELHSSTLSPLVAPLVQGQRANPVLFDRQTFGELEALQGDAGGRSLFSRYKVTWLPWHDPSVTLDVDTLADYQKLLEL
jgi:molybdenum cofactor cytidylyltransferase